MTNPAPNRPTAARPGHRLSRAAVDIPLRAAAGWRGREQPGGGRDEPLPEALAAERREIASPAGRLAYYVAGPQASTDPPVLLVHSINAAGSAYEVGPIFEPLRARRHVYALELPGFGHSERSDRVYTPRLMADAIVAMVEEIQRRHGPVPVDALALSLSAEFLAHAAALRPALFRSLALVSPTGFDGRAPRNGPPGSTRAMPKLHRVFTFGLWRSSFFRLLVSRVSIRYFLEKTWGSKAIDEGLLDYDYRTTHQPGAEHAPFCFISGFLFSDDITRVYESIALPVWMSHGVRGDFTDYRYERAFESRPNWTIEVFPTGALPQFEQPEAFLARYEAFLEARNADPERAASDQVQDQGR